MYHNDRLAISRPGLNIMHIQRAALIIIKRQIMRRKIIIRQIGEIFIGGFANFHKAKLAHAPPICNKFGSISANISQTVRQQRADT